MGNLKRMIHAVGSGGSLIAVFSVLVLGTTAVFAGIQSKAQPQAGSDADVALDALTNLAYESKKFDDEMLRLHIRAQVADCIWGLRPDRAGDLILEGVRDIKAGGIAGSKRISMLAEYVSVARNHNKDLAKRILTELGTEKAPALELLMAQPMSAFYENEDGAVALARSLVREDNSQETADFATRAISENSTAKFLLLLNQLRQTDSTAANKLFLVALNAIAQGPPDPNNVLYLGLYLFGPGPIRIGLYDGQPIVGDGTDFGAAQPKSDILIRPYLETSAEVLSRFAVSPGQPGYSGLIEAKRFALRQLLPLYTRYDPDRVDFISKLLDGLGPSTLPQVPSMREGGASTSQSAVEVDSGNALGVEAIEKLVDVRVRDDSYFRLSRAMLDKANLEEALKVASKINDDKFRADAIELLSFLAAQRYVKAGEIDVAEKLADSKLSPVRRALVYYQLALAWAEKKDMTRSSMLISAATKDAARIDNVADRAQVYTYLAAGLTAQDPFTAFDLAELAIKCTNVSDENTGSDKGSRLILRSPLGNGFSFSFEGDVSIANVIQELARKDLHRSLELARGIKREDSRSTAIIAACKEQLRTPSPASNQEQSDTKPQPRTAKKQR